MKISLLLYMYIERRYRGMYLFFTLQWYKDIQYIIVLHEKSLWVLGK